MPDKGARLEAAHEFLQNHLSPESVEMIQKNCHLYATQSMQEQQTPYTEKEHDELFLMELERYVMTIRRMFP